MLRLRATGVSSAVIMKTLGAFGNSLRYCVTSAPSKCVKGRSRRIKSGANFRASGSTCQPSVAVPTTTALPSRWSIETSFSSINGESSTTRVLILQLFGPGGWLFDKWLSFCIITVLGRRRGHLALEGEEREIGEGNVLTAYRDDVNADLEAPLEQGALCLRIPW